MSEVDQTSDTRMQIDLLGVDHGVLFCKAAGHIRESRCFRAPTRSPSFPVLQQPLEGVRTGAGHQMLP